MDGSGVSSWPGALCSCQFLSSSVRCHKRAAGAPKSRPEFSGGAREKMFLSSVFPRGAGSVPPWPVLNPPAFSCKGGWGSFFSLPNGRRARREGWQWVLAQPFPLVTLCPQAERSCSAARGTMGSFRFSAHVLILPLLKPTRGRNSGFAPSLPSLSEHTGSPSAGHEPSPRPAQPCSPTHYPR